MNMNASAQDPAQDLGASGAPFVPRLRLYQQWLEQRGGPVFCDYEALRHWSVTDLDAFWQSMWDHAGMLSPTPHSAVLADGRMPGAKWFPGAQVNYARQVLRHVEPAHAAGMPAIVAEDEQGAVRELSWPDLRRQVASVALWLRNRGIQPGDRVVAVLPNGPEAAVAFLACAAIGAVWSVCAPDMGASAVLDRFRQIEPKVLIAADGVFYGGKPINRGSVIEDLRAALPSVKQLLVVRTPHASKIIADSGCWISASSQNDAESAAFEPAWLPFDHPLWIVYSSGTTGLPKALVHGHGGVLLTLHACNLHNDIGASYEPNNLGERFHWYSSTGWIMWNAQMSGLVGGATVCLYDGSPGGSKQAPDWGTLWRFAARHGVTFFGAGAAFYTQCMKAGVDLPACGDLTRVRALGSTGSPLSADVQRWGTAQFERVGSPDIWWCNISGGTDFAGAFVGGHRELPQQPGRMQCRQIGHAVEAWSDAGEPLIGQVGELVCTRPIPAMPLYLWNDPGNARYLASYFDTFPGVWRHGDWLQIDSDGSCTIFGRSDATINRHGLRMGTSEIYSAVEALPEVLDALVVDLEMLGRDSFMPLFVVLKDGAPLDSGLRARIAGAIRDALSPRFVPDAIFAVPAIPRTLSGKKQELPVKKLLLGQPLAQVVNRETMANPESLDWFVDYISRTRPEQHPAA